jgi:cytochrome c oxidase cbb3-type subunit 3
MNTFGQWWVFGIVVLTLIATLWLLVWTRKKDPNEVDENQTLDHEFDGIREYNKPLPRWWLNTFYLSMIFGVGYLLIYPGIRVFEGVTGWSSTAEWSKDVNLHESTFREVYDQYAKTPVEDLKKYPEVIQMGERLFANNCAACHGSNAKGNPSFPNLTDKDWLYGGEPEQIHATLVQGRQGMMPPMLPLLGEEGIAPMVDYVLSLSGAPHDAEQAKKAQPLFATCAACHGPEAKGNQMLGAPNLTDNIWLHGGSREAIEKTLRQGLQNQMPAFTEILSEGQIQILTAYVHHLSNDASEK